MKKCDKQTKITYKIISKIISKKTLCKIIIFTRFIKKY